MEAAAPSPPSSTFRRARPWSSCTSRDPGDTTADPASYGGEMWRFKALRVPSGCSPTFPSNAALVERAARFSVFAAEDSPPPKPKVEPADSDSFPICPIQGEEPLRPAKRKEAERSKARTPAKKSRSSEKDDTGGDKLPYVHVRARRGQATDSHSLAERARREKINARMKLLQELVPGCSKITGTALVLDEIINHVQSLQRQVEFLSMRLAAVNPRIDFTGLDSFISAECGRMMGLEQPLFWSEGCPAVAGGRRQQFWHEDVQPQHDRQGSVEWERDETTPHVFINPSTSLFGYDSAAPASLPNQLKTQL